MKHPSSFIIPSGRINPRRLMAMFQPMLFGLSIEPVLCAPLSWRPAVYDATGAEVTGRA